VFTSSSPVSELACVVCASLVLAVGCQGDPRKTWVKDFVAFTKMAPYDVVLKREEDGEELAVVVRDSMLPVYNSLIERLATDSIGARRKLYETLPAFLLRYVTMLEADAPKYSSKGDTLEARVPFQRPDSARMEEYGAGWVDQQRRYLGDMAEAMHEKHPPLNETGLRQEWTARYARLRRELREPDTLIVGLLPGPRLASLRTATYAREIEARRAQSKRIQAHIPHMLPAVRFRDLKRFATDGFASLSGTVMPGPVGWWPSEESSTPNLAFYVDCRVLASTDTLIGYTSIFPEARDQRTKFLCPWGSEEAEQLRGSARTRWQVRFRAGADDTDPSTEWIDLP
jgi:hypothetical protein